MCPLENHKNSDLDTPPPPTPRPPHPTTIYKKGIRDRVWHFGFETSRFRNFLIFFNDIGIGFGKFWYRKKYRYRFRKFLVSKKILVLKSLVSVSKIFGIEKSIGFKKFGIEKVSDSENTFEETRNHLKNIYIKGWRCLFLPIRKSSQKYQGVVVLVSANPEILSKISRGGGAFFC